MMRKLVGRGRTGIYQLVVNMSKAKLIILAIGIFVLVGVLVFFVLKKDTKEIVATEEVAEEEVQVLPQVIQNPENKLLVVQERSTDTIPVIVRDGIVNIFDVYKNAIRLEEGRAVFAENNDFAISYGKADDSFRVTIWSDRFNETRMIAEKIFLEELGISKKDACKLWAMEVVDVPGHPLFGRLMPLSFCGLGL